MRNEHICEALFGLEPIQKVYYLRAYGNIQRAYGFIRYYEARLHGKRPCYAYALALAAAKLVREARCIFLHKANAVHCIYNLLLALLFVFEKVEVI